MLDRRRLLTPAAIVRAKFEWNPRTHMRKARRMQIRKKGSPRSEGKKIEMRSARFLSVRFSFRVRGFFWGFFKGKFLWRVANVA